MERVTHFGFSFSKLLRISSDQDDIKSFLSQLNGEFFADAISGASNDGPEILAGSIFGPLTISPLQDCFDTLVAGVK